MINRKDKMENGIIFILEDARFAGPHVYVARLCKGLKVNSRVLLPRTNSSKKFKDLLKKYGIKFTETIFLSKLSRQPLQLIYYLLMFIPEITALTLIFFKSKEGIIYCAGGSWQIKGAIAGYLSGKSVVWHLNDTYVPSLVMSIFKSISFLADTYVHASEATKEYYHESLAERPSAVIPAPIDAEIFSKEIALYNLKDKDKIIIGTICNINPIKNLEDFIEIAKEVSLKNPNRFEFKIAGPIYDSQINYLKKLKGMIKNLNVNNVTFVGPTDDIKSCLESFDIFLFTSKSESSPLVIWEALMSGLPVVTYRVGDIDKYIVDKISGLTAEVFDKASLCEAIYYLISDNKIANKLKTNARKTAIKYFSHTKCAELHVEYFSRLI